MSINLILLIMCLAVIQAYASQNNSELLSNRIVGGYRCSVRDHNFMVAILLTKTKSFHCGGSLLASRWVLTARQCVYMCEKQHIYMVVAGVESPMEKYWGDEMQSSLVKACYLSEVPTEDIGLMHLEKSLKKSWVVGFAVMATHVDLLDKHVEKVCSNSTILGWGKQNLMDNGTLTLNNSIRSNDSYLQCFNTPAISQHDCNKKLNSLGILRNITDPHFCVLKKNTDFCMGDPGSPIICKYLLHGIVAQGYGCACKQFPGIYIKSHSFHHFIMSTMVAVDKETAQMEKCSGVQRSFLVGIIHQDTKKSFEYLCAGSLLTEMWVLTSILCALKCETPSYYTVVAGLEDSYQFNPNEKGTLLSKVAKCFQFRTHNELGGIALMKLKNGFHPSEKVSYIRFATPLDIKNNNFEKVCNDGMLIGYERSKKSLSHNPQCVQITATSDKECKKKWSSAKMRDQHGCIDGLKSDNCYTTLGTPLVCNGIQFGVLNSVDCTERTNQNANNTYVIAKVYKFHDFLQKMVYIKNKKESTGNEANRNMNNLVNLYIFIFYFVLYVI